jgi:hypothetical protein
MTTELRTITVRFTGTITVKIADEDCEGHPYDGDLGADIALNIDSTLRDELMYEPDSLEETDFVQEIVSLAVTGELV